MPPLFAPLVVYVEALAASARATTHANDRASYSAHLAAAALMFAALHRADDPQMLELVESERVAYGRSFLSGNAGDAAEAAFARFAALVEAQRAA